MKKNYNIFIPTIFIGLAMFTFNQTSDKRTQDKSYSLTMITPKDTSITIAAEVSRKPDFDVEKFLMLTDYLLTNIQVKPLSLTFKIDTITADKTDKRCFFNSLFPSDHTIIKQYSFDPGKGSRELRIWFVEATYQNTI